MKNGTKNKEGSEKVRKIMEFTVRRVEGRQCLEKMQFVNDLGPLENPTKERTSVLHEVTLCRGFYRLPTPLRDVDIFWQFQLIPKLKGWADRLLFCYCDLDFLYIIIGLIQNLKLLSADLMVQWKDHQFMIFFSKTASLNPAICVILLFKCWRCFYNDASVIEYRLKWQKN